MLQLSLSFWSCINFLQSFHKADESIGKTKRQEDYCNDCTLHSMGPEIPYIPVSFANGEYDDQTSGFGDGIVSHFLTQKKGQWHVAGPWTGKLYFKTTSSCLSYTYKHCLLGMSLKLGAQC